MENSYEQHDWFLTDDVEEVTTEEVVEEVTVEEPIVEKTVVEEVVEESKKDFVKKAKKSGKDGKVVYATKVVKVAGIEIPKGYSKVAEDLVEEIIKHPKVRLASESEILTYWEA